MAERESGGIAYLVVAEGGVAGVGERLHALAWGDVVAGEEGFATALDAAGLAALPEVDPTAWPATAPGPILRR